MKIQVQPVTGKGSQENDVIETNAYINCDFRLSELLSGGSYHFDVQILVNKCPKTKHALLLGTRFKQLCLNPWEL